MEASYELLELSRPNDNDLPKPMELLRTGTRLVNLDGSVSMYLHAADLTYQVKFMHIWLHPACWQAHCQDAPTRLVDILTSPHVLPGPDEWITIEHKIKADGGNSIQYMFRQLYEFKYHVEVQKTYVRIRRFRAEGDGDAGGGVDAPPTDLEGAVVAGPGPHGGGDGGGAGGSRGGRGRANGSASGAPRNGSSTPGAARGKGRGGVPRGGRAGGKGGRASGNGWGKKTKKS